jgi:hypothetical protein
MKILSWRDCSWISNIFYKKLGGIDATYAADKKGTNSSIAPMAMLKVFQALLEAAGQASPKMINTVPVFLDAGASEGRALLHWAYAVSQRKDFKQQPIDLFGIELPHLTGYADIHKTAELFAERNLRCPVRMHVVWKDVIEIRSLRSEFNILCENSGVLYSFWTCWLPQDKMKLLALVAKETNIIAIAVYVTCKDLPADGRPFTKEFIQEKLCQYSSCNSTWVLHASFSDCRFINGNETATAVLFRRHRIEAQSAHRTQEQVLVSDPWKGYDVLALSPATEDGWIDWCMECAGGGGG